MVVMDLQLEMMLNQLGIGELEEVIKYADKLIKQKQSKRNPAYKLCLSAWGKFYKDKTKIDYIYSPKDLGSLKQLIKKCEQSLSKQGVEHNVESLALYLYGLLNSITDKWILDNLSIAIVNSKFNEIQLKAAKKVKEHKITDDTFKHFD